MKKNYEKIYKELKINFDEIEYYDAESFGKKLKKLFPKKNNIHYSSNITNNDIGGCYETSIHLR